MRLKGVRVYWINSSDGTIGSDVALRFTKDAVYFADEGWNDLETTYLTASQARQAAKLPAPTPKLRKAANKAAVLSNRVIELLEEAMKSDQ